MRAEALDLRFGSGPQVSLNDGFVHLRVLLPKLASVQEVQRMSSSVW